MKHKTWIHQLISALFAFVLAVGSIGNLITAYALPVIAMWKICLWCAVAAATIAVLLRVPHGGKIMIGLAALSVFGLCLAELARPYLRQQFETLFCSLTSHYHDVYNWPIWGELTATDVTVPLILWAVIVAFCVNWYMCRRTHIALAIVPAIIPLTLCLLTGDKVPAAVYAFLLVLALAILLATDWTRKQQPEQGLKLTLWLTLPIALAMSLLFLCNPQKSYINHAGKIQKGLSVWFEGAQNIVISVATGTPLDNAASNKVNLQAVGSKSPSTRSVMVVNSPYSGKLYLRERDYDVYTGTTWEATTDRVESFNTGADSIGTLYIATYSTRPSLFVPYYATSSLEMTDGMLENKDDLQHYKYTVSNKIRKTRYPSAKYRELPAETKAWAKALVTELTEGIKKDYDKLLKIQRFVRDSASYDTTAARMDSAYSDFAKWFLEECDTGYCVHYATAATVLLRAAGYPARYVEGYMVNGVSGKDVAVSKQEAHAWVEYYDMESQAWYIFEATPVHEQTEKPEVLPGKPQTGGAVLGDVGDMFIEDQTSQKLPERVDPEDLPTEGDYPEEEPSMPEETEAPDVPIIDDIGSQKPKITLEDLLPFIKILGGCILFVLCILLQGYLRIRRKRKLWDSGAPNERTIWRWRQTRSIANHLNQYYPDELDDLAKKARFSQHEMQPDELEKYEDYRWGLLDRIAEKPWYQRLFYKWILAID